MNRSLAWVSSLLLVAGTAQGFERQHESHEHGAATMLVALEGDELQLILESPAANFAGFEHAPRTEEQHQILEQVEKQLKQPEVVLGLPASAKCVVEMADLKHSLEVEAEGEDHHDDHDHDHDHEEHHDKDEHHDHEEDHHEGHDSHDDHAKHDEHKGHDDHAEHDDHKGHDHDGEEGGHSDYRLEYHFECENPAALKEIEVNLFKHFSLLQDLDVNYIGPNGQGAAELNPDSPRFRF